MVNSTRIGILLLLSASVHAFNTGRHHTGAGRSILPPLFYADIEPEIKAATIPPIVHFNGTSIFVPPSEDGTEDQSPYDRSIQRKEASESPIKSTRSPSNQSKKQNKSKPKASHRVTWQARYNELVAYKEQHGNLLVPQNYSPNPKFGLWVMQQRRQYSLQQNGKNSSFNSANGKKRVQLLNEIGFVWRVERRGPRGAYGGIRAMKHHADTLRKYGSGGNEILDAVNFEKYMIQKSETYSDENKRAAWRRRFEMFQ
ncbi:hypothetical protein ACHAXR_009422 [Thalassiosira sp. AJA248-18]